ncbi:MAG: ATP-grasp domain-containing protein [Candidatus Omnitrophica bacterium]|nr:ATP-grasp domain-containing protein [Candidatus Omnitrophota bacterium]
MRYQERVTILYDNSAFEKGRYLPSQEDIVVEVKAVEKALLEQGYKTRRLEMNYKRLDAFIEDLLRHREEVIFNLCEDIKGEGIYEGYVASFLELLGIDYTGSDPLTLGLCLDKAKAQELLSAHGLPTPAHAVLEEANGRPKRLHFPLIVKLLHEDGSLGLDRGSVVHDEVALHRRVKKIVKEYRQPVIAEEYLDGREFNISLLGNGEETQILPVSEIDHSAAKKGEPKILTYASKWDESSEEYRKTPPICPALLTVSLEKTLRSLALSACTILGCRDYARVDIRLKGRTPYIIEVNPNPCISSDAGFIRSADAAGLSYPEVIGKILECAIARKEARLGNPKRRGENVHCGM